MQKLMFDTGVQEFQLPGGVLRFNPSDPNVYHRFMEAIKKVEAAEKELVENAKNLKENNGAEALALMAKADKDTKAALMEAFGPGNDFDILVEGVNLMAVAGNGERVITNLLDALRPIIEQGAKRFYDDKANAAVANAKLNRAQRRRKRNRK
ncbi:hypothetical protein [uncultured Allofournierella sp.]|uniref:hypothetical protein n=1 Tax=uncultured Allofournierella sp. TaxID=1940258 RepID=UPI003753883B